MCRLIRYNPVIAISQKATTGSSVSQQSTANAGGWKPQRNVLTEIIRELPDESHRVSRKGRQTVSGQHPR